MNRSTRDSITRDELVADLSSLGIESGASLNVMVSLRSIGSIVGGAKTFIDALLDVVGLDGTLVTNSYVPVFPLPLSEEHAAKVSDRSTPSYAGAVANAMISYPGSHRSRHPVQKYAAIGKNAEELMQNHGPENYAYDVLRVLAETGGRLLKVGPDDQVPGVATTHTAIWKLGLHQRRPRAGINYRNESGELITFERDWPAVCSDAYLRFMPLCREAGTFITEGYVGHAEAKITDMGKTLDFQVQLLSKDPLFLLCDDPVCRICRFDWEFSDGSLVSYWFHRGVRYLHRQVGALTGSRSSAQRHGELRINEAN